MVSACWPARESRSQAARSAGLYSCRLAVPYWRAHPWVQQWLHSSHPWVRLWLLPVDQSQPPVDRSHPWVRLLLLQGEAC